MNAYPIVSINISGGVFSKASIPGKKNILNIQGYPQRMRLQRGLYRFYSVFFRTFLVFLSLLNCVPDNSTELQVVIKVSSFVGNPVSNNDQINLLKIKFMSVLNNSIN